LAAVVLAALALEDRQLLAAHHADQLGRDAGAGDRRAADADAGFARDQHHLVEGHGVACLAGQTSDSQHVVLLDAVLLAAGLDDCVHRFRTRTACKTVARASWPARERALYGARARCQRPLETPLLRRCIPGVRAALRSGEAERIDSPAPS